MNAQAKRDTKEAAVVKGEPGRKRKSSEPVTAQGPSARRIEVEVALRGNRTGANERLLLCAAVLIVLTLVLHTGKDKKVRILSQRSVAASKLTVTCH